MPRKARLDAPGTLHHVIIRGIERRPIVDDDKDRENFVSRLGQLRPKIDWRFYNLPQTYADRRRQIANKKVCACWRESAVN